MLQNNLKLFESAFDIPNFMNNIEAIQNIFLLMFLVNQKGIMQKQNERKTIFCSNTLGNAFPIFCDLIVTRLKVKFRFFKKASTFVTILLFSSLSTSFISNLIKLASCSQMSIQFIFAFGFGLYTQILNG